MLNISMSYVFIIIATIVNKALPTYLSSDNDPLFTFHRWQANLRVLEIEETKTVPYVPMSHPY